MLLALATLAITLGGSLQTEGRQGRPFPGAPDVTEVLADASLRAEARAEGASVLLALEPRLYLTQGRSLDLLQRGRLLFTAAGPRSATFTLEESVLYGRQDLSPLSASAATGSVLAPDVRFVDVASTLTTLRVGDQATRRLRWAASAFYLFGGGLRREDRGLYPQARQPGATLEASWEASRADVLRASAEARAQFADNGTASSLANLHVGLTHTLTRATTVSASTGLGYTQSRLSRDGQSVSGVLPTFEASLRSGASLPGQQLTGGLQVALAPTLDVYSGTAYTRADLGADLSWTLPRELLLSARGQVSQVVSGSLQGSRVLSGEAGVSLPLRQDLRLAATFRAADLRPQGQGALASGLQWTALLLLRWEFRAPG